MRGKAGLAAAVLCAGLLPGCAARGGHLKGSALAGAADGFVRFTLTPADNLLISLSIKHLPDPEKLDPPAWAYVAWIRTSGGPPLNLGPLNLGKDLNGELKTVTELREFELFVTAEPTAFVERPSGEPLLWTSRLE
jgi:hypothetical protein